MNRSSHQIEAAILFFEKYKSLSSNSRQYERYYVGVLHFFRKNTAMERFIDNLGQRRKNIRRMNFS